MTRYEALEAKYARAIAQSDVEAANAALAEMEEAEANGEDLQSLFARFDAIMASPRYQD